MTDAVARNPDAGGQASPQEAPLQQAAQQLSLDTPQQFAAATSYEVRDELQEFLQRDLLGP